jgi:hypothetical protein
MPDPFDKELEELLDLEASKPAVPVSANQVVLMHSKTTAAAGGRAMSPRPRPQATGRGAPARPSQEDIEYYESTAEERERFISANPVVQSANGRDPMVLLNALKMEIAREQAVMAYQRSLNEKLGKDSSPISSRRIDALKKIADIELEMRKIGVDQIDVYSEKFQRVIKMMIDMVQTAGVETLNAEQYNLFFNKLTSVMDGWEEKAAELVR